MGSNQEIRSLYLPTYCNHNQSVAPPLPPPSPPDALHLFQANTQSTTTTPSLSAKKCAAAHPFITVIGEFCYQLIATHSNLKHNHDKPGGGREVNGDWRGRKGGDIGKQRGGREWRRGWEGQRYHFERQEKFTSIKGFGHFTSEDNLIVEFFFSALQFWGLDWWWRCWGFVTYYWWWCCHELLYLGARQLVVVRNMVVVLHWDVWLLLVNGWIKLGRIWYGREERVSDGYGYLVRG